MRKIRKIKSEIIPPEKNEIILIVFLSIKKSMNNKDKIKRVTYAAGTGLDKNAIKSKKGMKEK